MVLNLRILNGRPFFPIRSCRKKAGPPEVNHCKRMITSSTGDRKTNENNAPIKSNARLAHRADSDGIAIGAAVACTGIASSRGDTTGNEVCIRGNVEFRGTYKDVIYILNARKLILLHFERKE